MPAPTTATTVHRSDLADSFMEFDLESQNRGFIASQVFPVLEVGTSSGQFSKIPVEQLLQERDVVRAPGAGYSRGNFTFDTVNYSTTEIGSEDPVDDRERSMYRDFFDASQIATLRAFDAVMAKYEKNVADAVFNATTWTSNTTAITDEWDDIASIPITDVHNASKSIFDASGLWPNAVIMNRKVFRNLRQVTQIIDRSKSQNFVDVRTSTINEKAIAMLFDVEHVLVGGAVLNSANEGLAASLSSIWSDEYVMVCRIAESNDFKEPCIGRTLHWASDGSDRAGIVEQYREENKRSDIFRVRRDSDEVVLHVEAGHLLSNATT